MQHPHFAHSFSLLLSLDINPSIAHKLLLDQMKRPLTLYSLYKSTASATAVQPVDLSSRQCQLLQLPVFACHHTLMIQHVLTPRFLRCATEGYIRSDLFEQLSTRG